jgi:hypothetical protein
MQPTILFVTVLLKVLYLDFDSDYFYGTSTGNDNNIITGCTIKTQVRTCLLMQFTLQVVLFIDNSGVSITNNSIQDYYNLSELRMGLMWLRTVRLAFLEINFSKQEQGLL